MAEFTLYIGNKNYSSWSLRGGLIVRASGADFDEVVIPLRERNTEQEILKISPSGLVPCLHHGESRIWDSLAIGMYLNELFPDAHLWPADKHARRMARAISCEMHSGFAALRKNLPMNIRGSYPGHAITPEAQKDINRVTAIWRDARDRARQKAEKDDGFLFGTFGIADAMYAPVIARFRTYGVDVEDSIAEYMDTVWNYPAMKDWVKAAKDEPWILEEFEL